MKCWHRRVVAVLAGLTALVAIDPSHGAPAAPAARKPPAPGSAEPGKPRKSPAEARKRKTRPRPQMPEFVPDENIGAPAVTEGAGHRRFGDPELFVVVLAPHHDVAPAVTTSVRPVLFWFLSKRTKHKIKVTLSLPDGEKAVWEHTGDPPPPGVQRLAVSTLTDKDGHPLTLKPRVQYTFSVEVLAHADGRSKNPYSSCRVECVAVDDSLVKKFDQMKRDPERRPDLAALFGKQGIWWDMLAEISHQIETDSEYGPLFRERRAGLFEEVENANAAGRVRSLLREAAEAERDALKPPKPQQ